MLERLHASHQMSTRDYAKPCGGISPRRSGSAAKHIRPKGMLRDQRNAGGKVPAKARDEVRAGLRDVFNAPDEARAWQRARWLMERWESRFPELVAWMEETLHDALAVFSLPEEHRIRLRTNNGLERFHEELRRRSRVIRIFPNRSSCLRLCTALSMEQSEEWITGHRYLDMNVRNRRVLSIQLRGRE